MFSTPASESPRVFQASPAGINGLLAGSFLETETSGSVPATITQIGNRGRIMLPDLLGMRLAVFLAVFVPLLVLALFLIDRLEP